VVEKIHKYLNKRKMLQITSQTVFTEGSTTNTEFKDISWNEVSDVEKVKKIIGRITIFNSSVKIFHK
jgi:hypothetical protein